MSLNTLAVSLGSNGFREPKIYRLRDEETGRKLPSIEDTLARAFAGEAFRDLRLRMFLPALGRDALVRIDAEPLRAADGSVRGVIAAITEVLERSDAD